MEKIRHIEGCRICGNSELVPIVHLGDQYLTGVFPKHPLQKITHGPLELVRCTGGENCCGLVQLGDSYDPAEMYGESYGYRSSLNRSMVDHLRQKAQSLCELVTLQEGDIVLDIGSNDGTFLSFFPRKVARAGMDPSAAQLCHSYENGIRCIVDYFSAQRFASEFGGRKATVITSIAMFYDLENPQAFVEDIAESLADDGIWHFEQSYMPLMLQLGAYDTICHEHLEYYALSQVEWMLQRAGLRVLDVELNQVNGGSFAVTACKIDSSRISNEESIAVIRANEQRANLGTGTPYRRFSDRVNAHKLQLTDLLGQLAASGRKVLGFGASTKGNVILQFCGITTAEVTCIAEVNADKFGCFTPGTLIPIVSEVEALALEPDYLLAMPWHFRSNILERQVDFLSDGGQMIFPLPEIDVVGWPVH